MTAEESRRYLARIALGPRPPAPTWLITGGTSDQRWELGEFFGRALLCTDPDNRPCRRCADCRLAATHGHPDLNLVRGEGDKGLQAGLFRIDQVRRLKVEVNLSPYRAAFRVYLVDGEIMRDETANAFLKTLEEPPETARLILLARAERDLPPTVVSRAARVRLPAPAVAVPEFREIETVLKLDLDRPAEIFRLAQKLSAGPETKLKEFLEKLAACLNLALKRRAGALERFDGEPPWLDRLAGRFDSPAQLRALLDGYLARRREVLRGLGQPRLALETMLIALAAPRRKPAGKK